LLIFPTQRSHDLPGAFLTMGTHMTRSVLSTTAQTPSITGRKSASITKDTLTIVDVSDKSDMKMIARQPYDNSHYTHQGWLTEDMTHLMLNDELDEQNGPNPHTRTLLWNVESLETPTLVGSHFADVTSIDHNLYIKGKYGYLANYCSGLRILDATQMEKGRAEEAGYFDMVDYCNSVTFKGAWSNYPYFASGNIVVSSIELGLFMLKADLD